MAQNDADFVDEFDLDIRLWDVGSFGSLSEQFPTMEAARALTQSCVTCGANTCGCYTYNPLNCPQRPGRF